MLTLDKLELQRGAFTLSADLSIPQGTRVALIGPSGAGKSTLLSAIAGFDTPRAGQILWQGQRIDQLAPGKRPLSILFQDQNLFPHLDVRRNLGLGLDPGLRLSRAQNAQIDAALERVGLAGLGGRRPDELSGGQQGRVALARVLLRARPLLLLDEPFSALGPALKMEMLALVAELAAPGSPSAPQPAMSVLMVTHDPAEARALCPLTVFLAEGHAAAPVPTGALLDDPPAALRAYLGR